MDASGRAQAEIAIAQAMEHGMNRFRELCRRERQAALKPYLERVRDNRDRALAMEEQMQQDIGHDRMVSDSDLRHRIRLPEEQVRMLFERTRRRSMKPSSPLLQPMKRRRSTTDGERLDKEALCMA